MNYPLYWIGIRQSELWDTQTLFSGSITIFGPNQYGCRTFEHTCHVRHDYNQDSDEWVNFVTHSAEEILRQEPNCRFMLYAPEDAMFYGEEILKRSVCQNPQSLLELLDNKIQTRQWLSDRVPILPYKIQSGEMLDYDSMRRDFPGFERFVVQAAYSCGGSGTWLVTAENNTCLLKCLDPEAMYAVSPYQEYSISPNIHLMIYVQEVLLLPPSIQFVEAGQDGFSYKGADFPMYHSLPNQLDSRLRAYARDIGDVLRRAGYRGVCGIDFLIANDTIYLMEINPRFQSSTFLLNRAICEAGYDCSIQAMHLSAFQEARAVSSHRALSNIQIPYSCFHYEYQPEREAELRYIWGLLQNASEAECIDDGLDWNMRLERHTYLYKAVFRGSIAVLSPSFQCRLHGNVGLPPAPITASELSRDLERLKCMLLAHGARLSDAANRYLTAEGGFNYEEFGALDIVLLDHIYICVPYDTNRSELSPFCVEADPDGSYFLSYYGVRVLGVHVRLKDVVGEKLTQRQIPYHDITYLGNDRLRVYHRAGCYFKDRGIGCRFCDIPKDSRIFSQEDIFQALDAYCAHPQIRHYLIGGGSSSPDDDFSAIEAIAKHICHTNPKPIYLMSLPPRDTSVLARLKNAGITEVAFNLEVFDREIARLHMPGKGAIPFSTYENAFRTATELWGRTGNVRTIFIVGLETSDSLLRGVAYVAKMGVSPILSLFRPIEGTPLESYLAPSDAEIWNVVQQAKAICRQYGVSLGPECPYCQDNTLKISL